MKFYSLIIFFSSFTKIIQTFLPDIDVMLDAAVYISRERL